MNSVFFKSMQLIRLNRINRNAPALLLSVVFVSACSGSGSGSGESAPLDAQPLVETEAVATDVPSTVASPAVSDTSADPAASVTSSGSGARDEVNELGEIFPEFVVDEIVVDTSDDLPGENLSQVSNESTEDTTPDQPPEESSNLASTESPVDSTTDVLEQPEANAENIEALINDVNLTNAEALIPRRILYQRRYSRANLRSGFGVCGFLNQYHLQRLPDKF